MIKEIEAYYNEINYSIKKELIKRIIDFVNKIPHSGNYDLDNCYVAINYSFNERFLYFIHNGDDSKFNIGSGFRYKKLSEDLVNECGDIYNNELIKSLLKINVDNKNTSNIIINFSNKEASLKNFLGENNYARFLNEEIISPIIKETNVKNRIRI